MDDPSPRRCAACHRPMFATTVARARGGHVSTVFTCSMCGRRATILRPGGWVFVSILFALLVYRIQQAYAAHAAVAPYLALAGVLLALAGASRIWQQIRNPEV